MCKAELADLSRAFLRWLVSQLSAGLVPNAVMMVRPNQADAVGQPHTSTASTTTGHCHSRQGSAGERAAGGEGGFDIAKSWA